MLDLALYLVLGVALGTVGGLFGIGGGLIAIPVLGVFYAALVMVVGSLLCIWNVKNVENPITETVAPKA